MLTSKELKSLISGVYEDRVFQFSLAGSTVTLEVTEKGQHIHLLAPVYVGENFIPQSVRAALKKKPPFDEGVIRSYLVLNEENFQVLLHYEGGAEAAQSEVLGALMDEFGFLVDHWKAWLDEHDKHDLIYVVNRP